jgi:hypothetical protein
MLAGSAMATSSLPSAGNEIGIAWWRRTISGGTIATAPMSTGNTFRSTWSRPKRSARACASCVGVTDACSTSTRPTGCPISRALPTASSTASRFT